jgi:histidyl-tRNA synthetase
VQVPDAAADAYAIVPPGTPLASVVPVLEKLRAAGVRVVQHAGGADGPGSMKSQFKKADASGARYALIFGADEIARGQVALKSLRDRDAAQVLQPLAAAQDWAGSLR